MHNVDAITALDKRRPKDKDYVWVTIGSPNKGIRGLITAVEMREENGGRSGERKQSKAQRSPACRSGWRKGAGGAGCLGKPQLRSLHNTQDAL